MSVRKKSVLLHSNPLISERDSMAGIRKRKIDAISFRNKNLGWKKYSFALDYIPGERIYASFSS